MRKTLKTKSGTASFYVVSITALILTIIAISFISITISEMARTTNSDLSNSAYDSAMAGVEDAKVALLNYQSCLNQGFTATKPTGGGSPTCGEIIWYMENPDCDTVGHILGRIEKGKSGEVLIDATGNKNETMAQAYTCALIETKLDSYTVMLSEGATSQLIPLSFEGTAASSVKSLRVSWYADTDGLDYNYGNKLGFGSLSDKMTTPPTLGVQLIQTAASFNLSQFDTNNGNQTDRGTLFFVATDTKSTSTAHRLVERNGSSLSSVNTNAAEAAPRFYDITGDGLDSKITMSDSVNFATANNKQQQNVPILTYCPKDSGRTYACSVSIELPEPIGGARNDSSFMLLISMPFGGMPMEVSIEACTENACTTAAQTTTGDKGTTKAQFKGAQYVIDSTGRANNLFRRVKTLLDGNNIYYPFTANAIEVLSPDGDSIEKMIDSNYEHNFNW